MKHDPRHASEPPTTQLSAHELRAYLADARTGSPESTRNREVDTSIATRVFAPAPRATTEPATRRLSEATLLHAPGLHPDRQHEAGPPGPSSDATRTCFASPLFAPRPRLGEAEGSRAAFDAATPRDASTERLTMFELSALEAPRAPEPAHAPSHRRLVAQLARAGAVLGPRTRMACLVVMGIGVALAVGVGAVPHPLAPHARTPTAKPEAQHASMVPAPAAALAALVQPTHDPAQGQASDAPLPSLRRAVDLLLAGHSRDALDAYRALARSPQASPALREVARLLEHEARACARRGGPSCP